jgi:hypothetical protein
MRGVGGREREREREREMSDSKVLVHRITEAGTSEICHMNHRLKTQESPWCRHNLQTVF